MAKRVTNQSEGEFPHLAPGSAFAIPETLTSRKLGRVLWVLDNVIQPDARVHDDSAHMGAATPRVRWRAPLTAPPECCNNRNHRDHLRQLNSVRFTSSFAFIPRDQTFTN